MAKRLVKTKYLIIGNSAGGIGAAEAIREVDKTGEITIISEEPYLAYSRPLISEYLAKRCSVEKMLLRPADFYERNQIRTYLGKKAEHLDINEHIIGLASGEKIGWERLLLATGGLPIVPEIKDSGLKGVFTFIKLDDAKAINEFLSHSRIKVKAVVVGGGLIGVSVAEALVHRGVDVTIVEMKERILNTVIDEEASALADNALKQAGVEIITGHSVAKVSSYLNGEATGVELDDTRPIPCGLVIVAIGVRPRTDLAVGTGIKVNRGIVVDRRMQTSVPQVFACGDAAEAYDFVYGENRLVPIWPNAYIGGRVAGFNMAGVPAEHSGGTAMNSLKYFGVTVASAGMVNPPDNSYEVISNRYDHTYRKVVIKDGVIVGMVFAGDIQKAGIVFNLMKERVEVEHFKQALVSEHFGLASLPEEIWRALLGLPTPGITSQANLHEESKELVLGE